MHPYRRPPWQYFALGVFTTMFVIGAGGLGYMFSSSSCAAHPDVVVAEVAVPADDDMPCAHAYNDEEEAPAPVTLLLNTMPTTRVFLDGVDTGRRTPVPPASPLHTTSGEHAVTFVTDEGEHYTYIADLDAGEQKLLVMQLGGPAKGNVDAEYLDETP